MLSEVKNKQKTMKTEQTETAGKIAIVLAWVAFILVFVSIESCRQSKERNAAQKENDAQFQSLEDCDSVNFL